MFTSVLMLSGGHRKVIKAFDYYRAEKKERMRLQVLVDCLTNAPKELTYMVRKLKATTMMTVTNPAIMT